MNVAAARPRPFPGFAKSLPLPVTLFIAAAALRLIAFAVFRVGAYVTHNTFIDPYDSVGIDKFAWYAAQHFRAGQWVDLRVPGLAGSWDVGFHYLVAFEYAVVGHHPDVARITDCLLASFCAPAIYLAARGTTIGEVVARRAGWLVAVWPLSLYWSGYDILKDPLIWFFLALALLSLTARDWRRRAVLGAIAAGGAYLERDYMGAVTAGLLLLGAVLQQDWKGLAATFGALAVVQLALVGAGFPVAWSLAPATSNVAATGSEASLASASSLKNPIYDAKRLVKGAPIEALGPRFALHDIRYPTLDSGMYPGLVVWIPLIPFTFLGLWRALKRRDPPLWSLAAFALSIWAVLAILYGGLGFRQREMAFPSTLLFTSLGLERPWPRWWWWLYAGLVALGLAALIARELRLIPAIA
jgi:hypothetical protein